MPTLQIHGTVVWIGLALFIYWNLFKLYSDISMLLLWRLVSYVVKHVMRGVFRVIECAAGVSAPSAGELASASIDNAMNTRLFWLSPVLVALNHFADTSTTLAWFAAVVLALAITCWSSWVEWQATASANQSAWRFRVVTLLSGCLALLSSALQWSFFATSPQPRDEENKVLYYFLILWTATLSIQLLQALTFVCLDALYAVAAEGRSEGGFDPMEKPGLIVRCVGSAAAFFTALMYCSDGATLFMKLAVMAYFFFLVHELSMLHRSNSILHPFPEISASGHCVICLEPIKLRDRARKLNCGHIFHGRCLHRWLMRADQCPICRQPTHPMQDDMISSYEFTMDSRSRMVRRLQSTQDIGVQTTSDLEYAPRHSTFHGSLRPLMRPINVRMESIPFYDISNGGLLTADMHPGVTMRVVVTPPSSLSSATATTTSLVTPPSMVQQGRQPTEKKVSSAVPPAVAVVESDEFADNPIVEPPRRAPRRRRRGSMAAKKTKKSAGVVGNDNDNDRGDEGEDEVTMGAALCKKVRL